MSTMFLAFGLMAIIMIAMAVGVIFGRQPISGSCGGAARLGIGGKCSLCGDDPSQCDSTEDSKSVVPVKRKPSFTDASRH